MAINENDIAKIKLLADSQELKSGTRSTENLLSENPNLLEGNTYLEVFAEVHDIGSADPQAVVDRIYSRVPHLKSLRESGTKPAKAISNIHDLCRFYENHLAGKKRRRDLKKKHDAAQARP